jgi:hypothetical protein
VKGLYDGGGRVGYTGGAVVIGAQAGVGFPKNVPPLPSVSPTNYTDPFDIGNLVQPSGNPIFVALEGTNLPLDLSIYLAKKLCNKRK